MEIHVVNNQSDLIVVSSHVEKLVSLVLANEGWSTDEVSVYFITNQKMCEMHDEYFDDPSPTDCISFPLGEPILGDVFVCPATAISYAEENELNPYEELSLYVVHGLLHLMGYDDIEAEDVTAMRAAEERHMKLLREADAFI